MDFQTFIILFLSSIFILTQFGSYCQECVVAVGRYIDFHNPHFYIELFFVLVIIWIFFKRERKTEKGLNLSEKESQELVEKFKNQRQPLYPAEFDADNNEVVLEDATSTTIVVDGRKLLNFTSYNFLGLIADKGVKEQSKRAMDKYGVGSCGPRGFYGTIDVHLEVEKEIAAFMGTEDAILYSYDQATVTSVIPAFCKRGDIVVYDEAVCQSIKMGVDLSRSKAVPFKHNDMQDLKTKLEQLEKNFESCKTTTKVYNSGRFVSITW